MKNILVIIRKNKELNNAGWIIGGKTAQMAISFVVGLWTARYLGPSNYGLINYVGAYTTFFTAFCTLGITSAIMISELTNMPEQEGTTLGTAMGLRLVSSFFSAVFIVLIVYFVDRNEPTIVSIAAISSLALIFQVFDCIEYWFQKRYLSKITVIASFSSYCVTAFYKVYLLISGKSVQWFAFSTTIDYVVIAVILFSVYKKYNGPRLRFSFAYGKKMLCLSYHFILSGMMVAIYGQTDKIMLKHMLSETDVGYYSTAASLSTTWVFVLTAIITSLAPTIMRLKREGDEEAYKRKNRQLYGIVFYLSIAVSVAFTIFAPVIINLLYGEKYSGAVNPLRAVTWYVAFAYLGVARDSWMVCENKQNYSKYMYLIACFANIGLNFLLIPYWGATGAAVASLITQIMTSIVIPLFFEDMRPNAKLMVEGIMLKDYSIKNIMKSFRSGLSDERS